MSKLIVAAGSHQYVKFKTCPAAYKLSVIDRYEGLAPKTPLTKGTLIHSAMALYYRLLRRKFSKSDAFQMCLKRFPRWAKKSGLENKDIAFLFAKFSEYMAFWQNELIQPIGIEVGFSEILFEDRNFIFAYEGKIDLIAKILVPGHTRLELAIIDHKTRSSEYVLDTHVDQFMGYAWVLRKRLGRENYKNLGALNYFGLQQTKQDFSRHFFTFTDAQLDNWEKTTIFWFHRLAQAKMFKIYPESWLCDSKFGVCEFKDVCIQTNPKLREGVLKTKFKQAPRVWRSWE